MARRNRRPALKLVSVKTLPGLTQVDITELSGLALANLELLAHALDDNDGALSSLNTPNIVLDEEQDQRIGNAVLTYLRENYPNEQITKDMEDMEIIEIHTSKKSPNPSQPQPQPAGKKRKRYDSAL